MAIASPIAAAPLRGSIRAIADPKYTASRGADIAKYLGSKMGFARQSARKSATGPQHAHAIRRRDPGRIRSSKWPAFLPLRNSAAAASPPISVARPCPGWKCARRRPKIIFTKRPRDVRSRSSGNTGVDHILPPQILC
jgi:hypothetical protein